ncbi:MAG: hypothetical protein JXQ73_01390 [Phycisphaerae bacterium]|nr:hypothetical protein [Phycisphaerae bacterium]
MTQSDSSRVVPARGARSGRATGFLACGVLAAALSAPSSALMAAGNSGEKLAGRISVEQGHPWRPPFGLDRVARPMAVNVEIASGAKPSTKFVLVGLLNGEEIARHAFSVTGKPPHARRFVFDRWPNQLELLAKVDAGHDPVRLAQETVASPAFEGEAVARPDSVVNPVDLGTILVPNDWLLLGPGQKPTLAVAGVSRFRSIPQARWAAWFESRPEGRTAVVVPMPIGLPMRRSVPVPTPAAAGDRDVLHVQITDAEGGQLWAKKIPTMLVRKPPEWPRFGARETKLRYDAPISVRAEDGTLSTMRYEDGWEGELHDVVVSLPNGGRFVFWRGSSYIPFWAGLHNTGLCYEWAETSPPPGFTDCVEPLMDKELRYGRVEIIESTAARVHVRWRYQSCDFHYKVWGESAVEDYIFYPDGFGTRVMTLKSAPDADYELSEFIILTPQATYPFSVLPPNLVDVIFMDGEKRELQFPFLDGEQGAKRRPRGIPAVYRVRLNRGDKLAAVYFSPDDTNLPRTFFPPFSDRGVVVTPAYWGSHWPLARGKTTCGSIDDRIGLTPAHNSIMSWARGRPTPLSVTTLPAIDTLGRSRRMMMQCWVWLIGSSDADDARLLQWAHSFAAPPALEVDGGRVDFDSYVPQRRAIRVRVERSVVTITVKPSRPCVHPVFELLGAPKALTRASLANRQLRSDEFAWDGRTLWLNADIDAPTALRLEFADSSR